MGYTRIYRVINYVLPSLWAETIFGF